MKNGFLPCTQNMHALTIFMLQRELALLSSYKIWNINIVVFKELGHDVHLPSETRFFMMWTSAIITFGILLLLLVFVLARIWNPIWIFGLLLLLLLLLLRILAFRIAFGLIRITCNKGLILGGFDGTQFQKFVLFPSQRLHEVCQWRNSPISICRLAWVECGDKKWIRRV